MNIKDKKPMQKLLPTERLVSLREIKIIFNDLNDQHSSYEEDYLRTGCQFARGMTAGLAEACSKLLKIL